MSHQRTEILNNVTPSSSFAIINKIQSDLPQQILIIILMTHYYHTANILLLLPAQKKDEEAEKRASFYWEPSSTMAKA